MRTARLLILLAFVAVAVGCGGGPMGSIDGGGSAIDVQGSWEIVTASNTLPGVQSYIETTLAQSGSSVSAGSQQILTVTVQGGSANIDLCSSRLSLSGTLSGASLAATLMEGTQSVRITGMVSPDGKTAFGTYQSDVGGCTQGDSGTFTANFVSSLSGSFTGTLVDASHNNAATTLQVNEGGNGSLAGSGQITDQGVTYNLSFGGSVVGAIFEATGTSTTVGAPTQILVVAHFNPTGTGIDSIAVGDTSGNILYSGTLAKAGSHTTSPPAFRFAAEIVGIGR